MSENVMKVLMTGIACLTAAMIITVIAYRSSEYNQLYLKSEYVKYEGPRVGLCAGPPQMMSRGINP